MKKSALTLLSLLLLTAGCSSENPETPELTITRNHQPTLPIGELFTDYRLVQLETSDSILVGVPQKTLTDGKNIFISDGRALFQFSPNGTHLTTLHREGRGPGEYRRISDFALTEEGVLLLDMFGRQLLSYTLDGQHLATYPLDTTIASIEPLDNGRVLMHNANQGGSSDKLIIFDLATATPTTSFWPIPPTHTTYRHFTGQNNFFRFKETLLFHEPMSNTIHQIEEGKVTPHRTLDLFNRNPPSGFWDTEYIDVMDIQERLTAGGYAYGTPVYAEGDNRILFTFRDPAGYHLCLHDKRTGTSVQFDSLAISPDGRVRVPASGLNITATTPDRILLSISANHLIDNQNHPQTPNPLICIATLP
jgi:hypothetical protein